MKTSTIVRFAIAFMTIILQPDPGKGQDDPARWEISRDKMFTPSGEPISLTIEQLVSALESTTADGAPVSKQELITLVSKPESHLVYYEQILKYATPLSRITEEGT